MSKFTYMLQKKLNLKRGFDSRRDICKEDLAKYIRQGAILIDVRSPQEYREGHINGAISIPNYLIRREIEHIITNKSELIVVYCSTGNRSIQAQRILERMGYSNVYNLYEGIIL